MPWLTYFADSYYRVKKQLVKRKTILLIEKKTGHSFDS